MTRSGTESTSESVSEAADSDAVDGAAEET
jgi:hypothetical protein